MVNIMVATVGCAPDQPGVASAADKNVNTNIRVDVGPLWSWGRCESSINDPRRRISYPLPSVHRGAGDCNDTRSKVLFGNDRRPRRARHVATCRKSSRRDACPVGRSRGISLLVAPAWQHRSRRTPRAAARLKCQQVPYSRPQFYVLHRSRSLSSS